MNDEPEDNVIAMKPKPSAREVLDQVGTMPREPASPLPTSLVGPALSDHDDDPIPSPGARPDKAHARPSVKPEATLGFLMRPPVLFAGFPYHHLSRIRLVQPEKPGAAPVLMLEFGGAQITEVVIEGRNLLYLVDLIRQHRMGWVRECPVTLEPRDPASVQVHRITITEPQAAADTP